MVKYITTETASLLTLKELGAYHKKIGICPKCKKDFIVSQKFYACSGYFEKIGEERACDFGLPKTYGGRPLTETDVKQLISGEMTKPKEYTWKNGHKSTTSLVLKDFKISFPDHNLTKEVMGKCPLCNSDVIRGKHGYYCESWNKKDKNGNPACSFSIFGKVGESEISPVHMAEILNFGETKKDVKIKWKSGKSFSGRLILEKVDDKFRISIKPFERKNLGECPYCKLGNLWEEQFRYECDNLPSKGGSCLISIPKTFCGSDISVDEAKQLACRKKIYNKSFVSKNGKPYKATVETIIDEQKGFNLKIKFTNNN